MKTGSALSRPTIGQTVSRTGTRKTTETETIPLRPYRCYVNGPGIIAAGPERERKKLVEHACHMQSLVLILAGGHVRASAGALAVHTALMGRMHNGGP